MSLPPGLMTALTESLHETMQHDLFKRRAAEQRVTDLQGTPGFALCLVALTLDSSQPLELRQLAAVVLKHFVRARWSGESGHATVCDAEKAAVRTALPSGLADRAAKIRTAVGMAIACIAHWDWPDAWPGLMGELLAPLRISSAAAAARCTAGAGTVSSDELESVAGVLRCVEECAAELHKDQLSEALQALMPLLLPIAFQPWPQARSESARAVRVLHKLLERLLMLCDDKSALECMPKGSLAQWVAMALEALRTAANQEGGDNDADADDGPDFCLEIALIHLLRLLVVSLPRSLTPHSVQLLQALGQTLLRATRGLEAQARAPHVDSLLHDIACDSDGAPLGLEALVTQLLDAFAALAASSRFFKTLQPCLPDVIHAAIGLLQISTASEASWEADVSQYLQDEDPAS